MTGTPFTYNEFWHEYLRAHTRLATRLVHYFGMTLILSSLVLAAATGTWWVLLPAIAINYACDWSVHYLIERNRPVVFDHPLWAALSAWRMFGLSLTGRLEAEQRKAGVH